MKTIITIAILWTGLIAVADHNREAPTKSQVASHCEQVEIGYGEFICK